MAGVQHTSSHGATSGAGTEPGASAQLVTVPRIPGSLALALLEAAVVNSESAVGFPLTTLVVVAPSVPVLGKVPGLFGDAPMTVGTPFVVPGMARGLISNSVCFLWHLRWRDLACLRNPVDRDH